MDHQIRLRWTSHQGTMMSVFDALLTSESLVDVTLACEGQFIRAHKIILSACSPYFQALINIDETKHPIFFLKDVKFTELKALIQYMYRGEVSIAQEDLPSLLTVSQALRIRGLADVETETNSISSDTIILPEHGSKNRVTTMPTMSPAPPPVNVAPPPTVAPPSMVSPNFQVPRTFQQMQSHNTSGLSNPFRVAESDPPSAPPPKKSRMETRQSTQTLTATTVQKQSQMVDPLLDLGSPTTVVSSLCDPLQTESAPRTSTPSDTCHRSVRSQNRDFEHRGVLEDPELLGTEMVKLESNDPIEIDLEEEENSLSQSSFSGSWQMGDGDNSQMADDDGELPGGSGNNDGTSAEGGEVLQMGLDQCVFKCPNPNCGRIYKNKSTVLRHFRFECNKAPQFVCICGSRSKRKDTLMFHQVKCKEFIAQNQNVSKT